MDQTSLESTAATSDDEAVLSRYTARNFGVMRLLTLVFVVVGVVLVAGAVGNRGTTAVDLARGLTTLFLNAAGVYLLPRIPALRRHMSGTLIAWCTTQFGLLLILGNRANSGMAWSFVFPLMLVTVRMVPSEIVLLHALLVSISGGTLYFGASHLSADRARGMMLGAVSIHGMVMAGQLYGSRRLRQVTVADWSERRRSAIEQLRMRDELRYAREIQLSMLPAADPQLDWLDVAGVSLPASEVGGDYYDYFELGDAMAIVCGDVAGHGFASGIVLASIRSGFMLLRESLRHPQLVLQRLHSMIAETTRRRTLVTCAVLLVDRARRSATITSAGHPPLLRRRADGAVEQIDLFALPLGVRLPVNLPHVELAVTPGDVFVLHSDGVYEARNDAGESYDIERLQEALRRVEAISAAGIRDALLSDVEAFRGEAAQQDDMTLVVVRLL